MNLNNAQSKKLGYFSIILLGLFFAFWNLYPAFIAPLGLSLFFAYLLYPVVLFGERFRIQKTFLIFLLVSLVPLLLILLFIKIIPPIYLEILDLVRLAPAALNVINEKWIPVFRDFMVSYNLMTSDEFYTTFRELGSFGRISNQVYHFASSLWFSAPKVFGHVIHFFLVPVFTFFILKDWQKIRQLAKTITPVPLVSILRSILQRVDLIFKQLLKGQMLIAFLLGILYVIGFNIVGLQGATAIGMVCGICRFIPYLDVIVGLGLSLIVIFSNFTDFQPLIRVLVVFLVVQGVDGMIITPKVIGKGVGLHPIVVITSVLSFGELFGFWGILLAVPCVAIVKELVGFFVLPTFRESKFFKQ